jgi:hypothetical protein
VVTVHGADYRDGRVGIWMEYVAGRTLLEVVRADGALDPREAGRIGADLCRALAAVHGAGLVHRDLKAGNVMRDGSGRVVLMDFGAGALLGDAGAAAVGTPLYMAPEVLAGAPPTPRSDLYALGVLLYHLVTGAHPVEAGTLEGIREAHRRGGRVALRDRRPGLPDGFVRVVERALDPRPARRFATAQEMEAALAAWREAEPGASSRRLRLWIPAAAVVVAIALLWVQPAGDGSLERQAQVREALGAYDEARRLYERIVEIQEQRAGPDHVEVAHALVRLAHVRAALGDRAEAAALYRRALAIYEERLGAGHPSVEATRSELASAGDARADRGDPFVRPLDLERRLDEPDPAGPVESPLYRIDAGLVEEVDGRVLRLRASEPLFVYVLSEEAPERLALVFPLPGSSPVNPIPPHATHRLPAAAGPLVVVASPARLTEFEHELRRLRVPGVGTSVTRVPLSEATLAALRSAFLDPSALSRARPVAGHPEIVRGLWVRGVRAP